jgi:DNA-binding beta-propeller fold protein YncE
MHGWISATRAVANSRKLLLVGLILILGLVPLALALLRGGPPPREAGSVEPRAPAAQSPWHVLRACAQAQESADFAVLCPMRLPAVFGPPGGCNAPGPATVKPIRAGSRSVGLDVAGPLHLGVLRGGSLYGRNEGWDLIRGGRLAGIGGRLYYSPPDRGEPGYHADHLIFAFRRRGHDYVVSLHTSGERRPWTERDVKFLETVLDGLRPASAIEAPPRPRTEGARGSRLIGAIRLPLPSDVAVGGGRAWVIVSGRSEVVPIEDARLGPEEPIQVPSPFNGILYSRDGSLWVASADADRVSRINTASQSLRGEAIKVGGFPADLAMLRGELWVLNFGDRTLSRVDPAAGRLVAEPVDLPGELGALDAGAGRLWAIDCNKGIVYGLDPRRRAVKIRAQVRAGEGLGDIAVTAESVWVSDWASHVVLRLDPTTGRVIERIPAGDQPEKLAGVAGDIWVTDAGAGELLRIDASANRVVETLPVGVKPAAVAADHKSVWLLDQNRAVQVAVGGNP